MPTKQWVEIIFKGAFLLFHTCVLISTTNRATLQFSELDFWIVQALLAPHGCSELRRYAIPEWISSLCLILKPCVLRPIVVINRTNLLAHGSLKFLRK